MEQKEKQIIKNLWGMTKFYCGHGHEVPVEMTYKVGPSSMFYSCPRYYVDKENRPNERACANRLSFEDAEAIILKLSDIILENGRYHLAIIEEKTNKVRNFTVPSEVYIYIQNYALERSLKPKQRLFDISVRTVQNHLQLVCEYLGLSQLSTHSFRKFYAQSIYENNNYDIVLVKELLQHSSVAITQRYVGVGSQRIEKALQNHIILPT